MLSHLEDNDKAIITLEQQPLKIDPKDPVGSLRSFKKFYSENFGLKRTMVESYISLKRNLLNEQPLPDRVVMGKDSFFFLGNNFNKLLNDSFGMEELSEFELMATAQNIISIRDRLAKNNIQFYIVVIPNKHRIYQVNIPFKIEQRPTRLQQLNHYLKRTFDFSLISLEKELIAEKGNAQLYYKTNTHWNDLGAYIGYITVITELNKTNKFHISVISNFEVTSEPIENDIANMINLKIDEKGPVLEQLAVGSLLDSASNGTANSEEIPNNPKKLVMYHDSFGYNWMKFFNTSFMDPTYVKGTLIDYNYIESLQPDIVIVEIVERNLIEVFKNKENHTP